MKKGLIFFIELLIVSAVFANFAYADTNVSVGVQSNEDVNLGIGVNATGNVNVTIDGTNIGNALNDLNSGVGNLTQQVGDLNQTVGTIDNTVNTLGDNVNTLATDVYGTATDSPDHFLIGAENATTTPMSDYCSDPALNQYFTTFSSIPPAGFKQYMKSLGYDDEAHITLIWTICQEKRLNSIDDYISTKDGTWSSDTGISLSGVVNLIQGAVNWLLGTSKHPTNEQKDVAKALDSYFASDADINYLLLRTQDLNFRVSALEKTMDKIAKDSYCQGKLDVLQEYGLQQVSCGNVTYHNHLKNPTTGQDMIITIEPVQ